MRSVSRTRVFLLTTALVAAPLSGAFAQSIISLDVITVTAGKTSERAIDALAGVSYLSREELEKLAADLPSDVFLSLPGVFAAPLGDDKGAIVNIRGLQNFGRVAVTIDGARQDFSRASHAGNGSFYLEPELLKSVTVVRGPVGNTYGSGAIGGVVAFDTIDASDVLRDGESWALASRTGYESNGNGFFQSVQAANRFNDSFDVVGGIVYRKSGDYSTAAGQVVPFSAQNPVSGLAKATFRPADGHEIELSGMHYDNRYLASRAAGLPAAWGASVDDTHTTNTTLTGKWSYSRPDDELFDFVGTAYWNGTHTDQTRINFSPQERHYNVATAGFDVHNSSRAHTAGLEHKFTYGVDYFADSAVSTGDVSVGQTGSGERAAYGGFVQWDGKHDNWLDLMAALRYDGFNLSGVSGSTPVSQTGGRLSPKATIGITPNGGGVTVYGTYAEGYRAPSITETFVMGTHQGRTFLPNPNLLPETARNLEAGVNVKYDNLAREGDSLRVKADVFHTMVDDYIDFIQVSATENQYQNVGAARLVGVELEGTYDIGWAYLGLAGSYVDGRRVSDGTRVAATTPDTKFTTTLGLRNSEWNVEYGAQWQYVGGTDSDLGVTAPYSLVNLFAKWQVNQSVSLGIGIDNLFNVDYTDPVSGFIIADPSYLASNGRGRTFKVAISGRIGG